MANGAATVFDLVERQAAANPDGVFAVAADGDPHGGGDPATVRFGDLRASCRELGAALDALGIAPGETVSVVMANGLQTLRLLLGTMHAGRCVHPVNLLAQPEQMRYVLDHADSQLVVAAPEWAERVAAMLATIERPVRLVVLDPSGDAHGLHSAFGTAAAPADAAAPPADRTALLMYTSGTTGVPKGVMLTQAALAANAEAIATEHALRASDRVLGVLPLYHINAFLVTMLAPLASGGSVAMAPKFSAASFWPQAVGHGCTWLNVVPTIVSYLLEGDPPADASALAPVRFCRSASAALPPEHHRSFERKFGVGIVETMGLTETAAPSFSNPLDPAARKIGSVGRASGGEARVLDAALAPVADGQTGEIVIRGPHVMRGYYKNDETTRAAFTPDGWLRTGDLGHRDGDGFFFVTGRLKELIIKGGENIAPREIDEVLLAHPAVLDAAAVGIPDRHYGQEIGACVVRREGMACDEAELRAWCGERLGRYRTPKAILFVEALPRGPSGKVQRLRLAAAFAG